MKLCKDCKHFRENNRNTLLSLCGRTEVMVPDYVYGDHAYSNRDDCAKERRSPYGCGEEGRFWEAK